MMTSKYGVILNKSNPNIAASLYFVVTTARGILCALKKLNCQEGYYVGDNVTDIQAGKNAGIKTVGVKWSPKGYALIEKEHPDLLINDYQEFINYIKEKEKC